jgi:hypothetical protein
VGDGMTDITWNDRPAGEPFRFQRRPDRSGPLQLRVESRHEDRRASGQSKRGRVVSHREKIPLLGALAGRGQQALARSVRGLDHTIPLWLKVFGLRRFVNDEDLVV